MRERLDFIDSEHVLSTRKQCEILSVHRSGLYYKPQGEKKDNLEIMRIMDEHYLKHPTAGVIRMQDLLLSLGMVVNHKRVRRLLRLMGMMAIYPRRNLSKLGLIKYIRPYLLKGMKIERSNQVWAIDITYIPMKNGFLYLTAIIDLYSRYIVGWGISNTLDAEASLSVMKEAIKEHGKPEIINSDQGSQFTSDAFTGILRNHGIKISMDSKGRWIDNVFIERLWRSVKYQDIYLKAYTSIGELKRGLAKWFDRYDRRRHQGLDNRAPNEVYWSVLPRVKDAV